MKFFLAACAILAMTGTATAQSSQPPTDQPPPAQDQQSAPPTANQPPPAAQPARPPRTTAKPNTSPAGAQMQPRTVSECRDQARARRMQREQRKDFMRDCRMQVADACRNQAQMQNIRGDARRDFLHNCMGTPARGPRGAGRGPGVQAPGDEPMDEDDGAPPPAPPRQ